MPMHPSKTVSDSVKALADDYGRSLIRRGKSPNTLRGYGWALHDLATFAEQQLGKRATLEELTRPLLEAWQDDQLRRGLAPRTRALAVTAVRGFLAWAEREELEIPRSLRVALEPIQAPRLLPRPIPEEDLLRILHYLAPVRPKMPVKALRDRALFLYLLGTGCRVSEALQIDRDLVDRQIVVWQKGGRQKVLFAPPVAMEAIAAYLAARKDNHQALFVALVNPVHRLSADGVREIWRQLARRVGVPRWTTHQLRHTSATLLIDAGVPELVAAAHLGHSGLRTIHVYAEVRQARRQEAVDALEGMLRVKPGWAPRLLPRLAPRKRRPPT